MAMRKCYCGLAGTVMRFRARSCACSRTVPSAFDGDEQAYARPMKPVLDGLATVGRDVSNTTARKVDCHLQSLHLQTVRASALKRRAWSALIRPARRSSFPDYCSSALECQAALELHHTGKKTPSLPHIRMTVADLHGSGVRCRSQTNTLASGESCSREPCSCPNTVTVEPDLSNAAPFLGAALIAGGTVRVPHWPESTTQPGGMLPGYLGTHGSASVSFPVIERRPVLRSDRQTCHVSGLGDFDLTAAGEIAPSLAAILVFADKPTRMIGIGHLRGHETNRLEALVNEITRVGGAARELPDGLEITPCIGGSAFDRP